MNCPYCEFETDDGERMAVHLCDAHLFIVANSELEESDLSPEVQDMAYNIFTFGDEYLSPTT